MYPELLSPLHGADIRSPSSIIYAVFSLNGKGENAGRLIPYIAIGQNQTAANITLDFLKLWGSPYLVRNWFSLNLNYLTCQL